MKDCDLLNLVASGDLVGVRDHLDSHGYPAPLQQADEDTPLTMAARLGFAEIVACCLNAGASPNEIGDGTQPLFEACQKGHLSVVKLLVTFGADVDARDETDATPLVDAAAQGHKSIVEYLLSEGADPQAKDMYGEEAVMFAVANGHTEIVDLLMPLSTESAKNVIRSCQERLAQGSGGRMPSDLFAAVRDGDSKRVGRVLASGVDVNFFDDDGTSVLMKAAHRGNLDIVRQLVDAGADIQYEDKYGTSAVEMAALAGQPATFDFLYDRAAKTQKEAALAVKEDMIRLGQWISPDWKQPSQDQIDPQVAAAVMACLLGNQSVVLGVLAAGISVDATNVSGKTMLMAAAQGGHVELVRELIERGADVNITDKYGNTAMDYTSKERHRRTYDYLTALYEHGTR